MRQPESKIFEAYAKLAEEKGLVSNAEHSRKTPEQIEAIELLYGVKPNGKENLVEKAHPDTAVASQSYDAMDGVVENIQQRNDVMTYVALKTPDGLPIHRKYVSAYEDLMKSIVRAGFKMDSEKHNDLMRLADSCAGRLEKKAIGWIPLAAGIASVLGLIAAINNTENSRQNVVANAEQAIKELNDLKTAMPIEYIIDDIQTLINMSKQFHSVTIQNMTAHGIIEAVKQNPNDIKAAKEYYNKLSEMTHAIPEYINDLKAIQPQTQETYDWWQKIKDVMSPLMPDDTTDAIKALSGLSKAVSAESETINYITTKSKQYIPEIGKQLQEKQATQPVPQQPAPQPAPQEESALSDLTNVLLQ